MSERPTMDPEVAAALRAYEREVLDGTERSQRLAFETLRLVQQRQVGAAALEASPDDPATSEPVDQTEPQPANT